MVVVKDPVCGMVFVKEDAAGQSFYNGETYYFCAPSCKKSFENDPEIFLATYKGMNSSEDGDVIKSGENKKNEKDNSLREHN